MKPRWKKDFTLKEDCFIPLLQQYVFLFLLLTCGWLSSVTQWSLRLAFVSVVTGSLLTEVGSFFRCESETSRVPFFEWEVKQWLRMFHTGPQCNLDKRWQSRLPT